MKRILTVAFISLTLGGFAQRAQVQSAYSYLKYEQLDKAKECIDIAVNNENTMNYDKAWYYRGLIYQALYKNEKFANLSNDPLNEALRSYNKALELNPKFEYADDISEKKKILAQQFADMGYVNYNLKNYAGALTAYEGVVSIMPNDTSSYFNAALCAERAGNAAKAKQYYNKLDEMQYKDAKMYHSYAQLYLSEGDTAKALEVLSRGLSRFPEEKSILPTDSRAKPQSSPPRRRSLRATSSRWRSRSSTCRRRARWRSPTATCRSSRCSPSSRWPASWATTWCGG